MSISVTNLSKFYGSQKAVDTLSFEAGKSEIVGFLGPNGAGKSTTMKIITGYLTADEGTVRVCGLDMAQEPLAGKQKIGYLPENNPLYYDMYIREYLHFIADVHQLPDRKKRIEEVIDRVGLGPESRKKTGQLSKGYKQRVGLAAALLHNPEVLILDEPTTGLDPNQIVEIREVIRKLGEDKTVLFSSHILQEVEAICDRAIIINKGRMVANDTITALRQRSANGSSVRVTFRERLDAAWFNKLTGVRHMERMDEQSWLIEAADTAEMRKQILEMALQQNLNIVSLQSGELSLEDVFRTLTNQAGE